jgi:hypothetical protein
LGQNRQSRILVGDGLSDFDATATLAVRCDNGFDAGFGLLVAADHVIE